MLSDFLNSKADGFFYIGHSSALIRINGCLIACDPVWGDYKPYGDSWIFWPPQIICDDFTPDFIFISHIHADHFCLPVMLTYNTPPRVLRGSAVAKKVHSIACDPFTWLKDPNREIEFYFVPHAFNSIDSSFFLRNPETGWTVYFGNDNFLSDELLEKIKPDIPRVDLALLPYAFIHWYPVCMGNMDWAEKTLEINRLKEQSLRQARSFIDVMEPKQVVPFGNSLFYRGGPSHPLNKSLATPFDLKHDNCGILPLEAGGWVMSDGSHSKRVRQDEYLKGMPTASLHAYVGEQLRAKVARATTRVKNHLIIVSGAREQSYTIIDLERLTVAFDEMWFKSKDTTCFTFSDYVYEKWFRGEVTFEEAIGTREFTCVREPNVYRLEVFEWMMKNI